MGNTKCVTNNGKRHKAGEGFYTVLQKQKNKNRKTNKDERMCSDGCIVEAEH